MDMGFTRVIIHAEQTRLMVFGIFDKVDECKKSVVHVSPFDPTVFGPKLGYLPYMEWSQGHWPPEWLIIFMYFFTVQI